MRVSDQLGSDFEARILLATGLARREAYVPLKGLSMVTTARLHVDLTQGESAPLEKLGFCARLTDALQACRHGGNKARMRMRAGWINEG